MIHRDIDAQRGQHVGTTTTAAGGAVYHAWPPANLRAITNAAAVETLKVFAELEPVPAVSMKDE